VNRQNEEDELTSQRYARDKEILEKIADENQEEEQLRGVVEVNEDLPPPTAVPTTPKKMSKQLKPNERTPLINASIKTPKLENIDRVRTSKENTIATAHMIATARSKSAKCKSRMKSTSLVDATQGTLEEVVKGSPESEQKLLSAKEATASTAKSFEQPKNGYESDLNAARNVVESDLKTARDGDESDLKTAREKEPKADTLLQLFTEKTIPDASIRSVYMI
uniref:RPAP1_N domain-containing protein n=1 Tax=Ascaris lumbricoides TaxID=6252 RepID=A0A0M3IP23_ASCLU